MLDSSIWRLPRVVLRGLGGIGTCECIVTSVRDKHSEQGVGNSATNGSAGVGNGHDTVVSVIKHSFSVVKELSTPLPFSWSRCPRNSY